jgi:hypothetical protein
LGDTLPNRGKRHISEQEESSLHASLHNQAEDTHLQRVLDAWPGLPAHIKAAVLALLQSAKASQ